MKHLFKVMLVSLFVLGMHNAKAEDTWSFDGSEKAVTKLVKEKRTEAASKVLYQEVYDNKMLCWSWDACADKRRVYGRAYDTYSFQ
ncbi:MULTISPECIES: hypothetical protein [Piscirickettsiaceae]|jgi:hypothetical protein|uniref:Uncharacterized protein n=1 Tax=Hydrogenovibrio thermophilus TaxID=265883 RepID=A0A410H5H5_9GAMM|nr:MULTISPECIES: hypothetical protein [Piscirickettsiaceae]AZR81174.1 hypothetical protein AYJ59_01975 [Thiomicrospira sp. S5]QAB16183.1 hypothetical protein EPV75_11170 [Hydrogenovibrio thermophilus]